MSSVRSEPQPGAKDAENSADTGGADNAPSGEEEQSKAETRDKDNVFDFPRPTPSSDVRSHMAENMTDLPSRDEIDAKLGAAEARTEARIAHLSSAVEIRYSQLDHKVDSLAGKMDFLVSAMSEMKSEIKTEIKTENRATRNMMWTASLGMLGIIVALVTWLYNAGLSEQANLLAAFQASLAVHGTGSPTLAPILGNGTGTVGPSTQPPATPSQPEKK